MAVTDARPSTKAERVLAAAAVMLAVLMVVLDMTVVNVALPHMMGALGATSDQITWVLTSYIVASAVTIPLSGYLAERFGRRKVMLVSVGGFVLASALCGQSSTLTQMVLSRLLQGVFGASVIPVSQAIMVDTFDAKDRGKAMAIWGIGVLMGPILGPTVGGFITDHMGWRWVFYINVPIGIANLALIMAYLAPSPPRREASADWIGALQLAVGIGCLQTLLDRGNREDWLQSNYIIALGIASVIGLALFVMRSLKRPNAVLQIDLLKDRNLAAATFMIMAFGIGMLSTIVLQPIFLEHLLGYPASTAGLVMAPRGIAVAVGMASVALLINRFEPRLLVLAGLSLSAAGSYAMTWYNLDVDLKWIILPGIVQGIGMGMIFVPLSTLAYQTLPPAATDQASSIFNLARTIGGSIGIAISATVLTRDSTASWSMLGERINPYDPALTQWLETTGLSVTDPTTAAVLGEQITRQATMLGFLSAFYFVALAFLALIPFVLLLSGKTREAGRTADASQSLAH
jgi:DHA2 family multidrug resistance protein